MTATGAARSPVKRYAALGAVAGVHLVLAWNRRWVHEDGFINIRIVDQLLAGNGPVFNAGERVEAYTSPLWLAVLALARVITFGKVPLEWLAVVAGIALAVTGTVAIMAGAISLRSASRSRPAWWLPLGILTVIALPPFWDFSSSGLENGLAQAWLGLSFAAVTGAALAENRQIDRRVSWRFALIGLGPLVRPELALYAVSLALALWLTVVRPRRVSGERPLPSAGRLVAAGLAMPVAYQIFRMGYFASLVPNTALAKDAGSAVWGRGWHYLVNFVGPYRLVVPAVALVALVVATRPFVRFDQRVVALAMVLPAAVHTLYIVWIGGDYMHGRFWLLPLTALVAPVAMVPVPRRVTANDGIALAGVAIVAIWTVACVGWWRVADTDPPVEDQRALVVGYIGHDHPVALADQPPFLLLAAKVADGHRGQDVFLDRPDSAGIDPFIYPRPKGAGVAMRNDAIGVTSVAAGRDVYFVDRFGLADPVAARLPTVSEVRAGHAHDLPRPWLLARGRVIDRPDEPGLGAARRAQRCGDLGRLLGDIHRPLTLGRFLTNLVDAPANTTLRIPLDPAAAEARFCGASPR